MRSNPSVWLAILAVVIVSCKGEHSRAGEARAAVRDAGTGAVAAAKAGALLGNAVRGASLYAEHCSGCHGVDRRGEGPSRGRLSVAPRDLRDPLFLVTRGEGALARTALEGGAAVGLSKEMPRFLGELSEQDALDVATYLKQGAVSLEECFPEGTHYALLARYSEGTFVGVYGAAIPEGGRPVVVAGLEQLPLDARKLGYVLLTDVSPPQGGQAPGAVTAGPDGTPTGVKVALPRGERERAEAELGKTLERYAPALKAVAQGKSPPGYRRAAGSGVPGAPQ